MVVRHHITVGGEFHFYTIYGHVCQTVSISLVFIINRYQRRDGVHFFQGILRLLALRNFEVQACVKVKDVFMCIQLQACVVLNVRVTSEDTFFISMAIRQGVFGNFRTADKVYVVVLCNTGAQHLVLPVRVGTCRILSIFVSQVARLAFFCIFVHHIVYFQISVCIKHIEFFCYGVDRHVCIE